MRRPPVSGSSGSPTEVAAVVVEGRPSAASPRARRSATASRSACLFLLDQRAAVKLDLRPVRRVVAHRDDVSHARRRQRCARTRGTRSPRSRRLGRRPATGSGRRSPPRSRPRRRKSSSQPPTPELALRQGSACACRTCAAAISRIRPRYPPRSLTQERPPPKTRAGTPAHTSGTLDSRHRPFRSVHRSTDVSELVSLPWTPPARSSRLASSPTRRRRRCATEHGREPSLGDTATPRHISATKRSNAARPSQAPRS